MERRTDQRQRFRLSASVIASHFKHRCDRRFRWNTVEGRYRGRPGIGEDVPPRVRRHSRPGIALLMEAGDRFEAERLREIEAEVGTDRLHLEGIDDHENGVQIETTPLDTFIALCQGSPIPEGVAQVELDFTPEAEARFLERFGLDPAHIKLGPARPDLIRFLAPSEEDARHRLQVWDFKASQSARHEHFIQVAYYTLLLEQVVQEAELRGVVVDTAFGVIRSRDGEEAFELEPYRRTVADFLRHRVPVLLSQSAADAHYHVRDRCMLCEYVDRCQEEADASGDLSRIPYITSASKRKLRAAGIQTHQELAALAGTEDQERIEALRSLSHDLSVNMDRYLAAACALDDGRPRTMERATLAMPQWDDVRIVLSAEQDGVTGTCFALGLKTYEGWDEERRRPRGLEKTFVAEDAEGEADMLLGFLRTLNGVLERIDRQNREAGADLEGFEAVRQQDRLHFYIYDDLDLQVLKSAMERHLFNSERPALQEAIKNIARLFPPESVLPDAETFRSMPGTVVTQVLRSMVALPVPYLYDLRSVSERYPALNKQGKAVGWTYRPRYGFGWERSNQVAFERIHNVWSGRPFEHRGAQMEPGDVLEEIRRTVRSKLRATDSVVRRMKRDMGDRLRLRKEPFRLHRRFDPASFEMIEALEVFTMLESSLAELEVKYRHTQPVSDRTARLECIRGLRCVEGSRQPDDSLWFTFDPACREAKFDEGDFALVVTPEDTPEALLGDVDGALFDGSSWRYRGYQVTLQEYDLDADPPRVRLLPRDPSAFRKTIDLSEQLVLDRLYVDYNTTKVFDVLHALRDQPEKARHVHELMARGTVTGWAPFVEDTQAVEAVLQARAQKAGADPGRLLNREQRQAWHGVFQEPMTLVWGPPGTGKTRTLAHVLLGYALAASRRERPLRLLVTANTHHAVANVLQKAAALADAYGLDADDLAFAKVRGYGQHPADADLPGHVSLITARDVKGQLRREAACLVVGSTVWGAYKAMERTDGVVQPWFDVVLIDEASQMRLPDALIAFSASRPEANIILAGDDRQLPPIIHGTYPEEHEHVLSSVFAFMRQRAEERTEEDPEFADRVLFQLVKNYRMNEPLTAYPREVLYEGQFRAHTPGIRVDTADAIDIGARNPVEAMLHPERPVVLCRYDPPRSYTASNPIEADLVAQMTARLSQVLIDDETGRPYDARAFAERGLAILSPHRAQNSTIRRVLRRHGFGTNARPLPLVDTVDKLQGKERDVVLVSYGVADEEYAEAEAEFLLSSNRFNVAATRARHKLVVFCSEPVLDVIPADRETLLDAMMLKEFRRYCDDGRLRFPWNADGHTIMLDVQWKGFADPYASA